MALSLFDVVDAVRVELGLPTLDENTLPSKSDVESAAWRGQVAIARAVDVRSLTALWAETSSLDHQKDGTSGLNDVAALRLIEAERNGVPCAEVSTTMGILAKKPGSMHEAGPQSPVIYRSSGGNWTVVPSLVPVTSGSGANTTTEEAVTFRAVYVRNPGPTPGSDRQMLLDENFLEPLVAYALGAAYRQLKLTDLMQVAEQRFQALLGLGMQSEASDAQ